MSKAKQIAILTAFVIASPVLFVAFLGCLAWNVASDEYDEWAWRRR
jgi:hypothetical protein